ncbi:DUF6083 domain-containing protein [Streptomyces sp. S1]|uniref:DUF6083 domain-containing protein n=1 Tax=Streptomyces sp. S1 TaxID=718288 RepID=UPI003D71C215
MTTVAPTIPAVPAISHSYNPETSSCSSCGLPGELWTTPEGLHVLLDSNDPMAPLRAGDVPAGYGWTVADHHAHPVPDGTASEVPCQADHILVCPCRPATLFSPALLERRLLNKDRLYCAQELLDEERAEAAD